MCRYAMYTYKEPFACFDCRKSFKQISSCELPKSRRPPEGEPRVVPCPQCGKPMAHLGHDFKAPPRHDVKQWEKIRVLFRHGFAFHTFGCGGLDYPEHLEEVEAFVATQKTVSEGERLLRRFRNRSRAQG